MKLFCRNVPGIALYMTGLTQLRAYMAETQYFASVKKRGDEQSQNKTTSVLPVLTMQGNLIAGATLRVFVGFLLNPISVLKARYEVCLFIQIQIKFLTPQEQFLPIQQLASGVRIPCTPRPIRTPPRLPCFISARCATRRALRRIL